MELSAYERELVEEIDGHGWFCVCVLEDEGEPGFAYSVGLPETLGTPELIVFGLDPHLMHGMLWSAFRQLRDGREVKDGNAFPGLIEGFDCIVRDVHASNIVTNYFNSALWYRGYRTGAEEGLTAVQIVWPSADNGRFPWEAGADPSLNCCQPPLYLPRRGFH